MPVYKDKGVHKWNRIEISYINLQLSGKLITHRGRTMEGRKDCPMIISEAISLSIWKI